MTPSTKAISVDARQLAEIERFLTSFPRALRQDLHAELTVLMEEAKTWMITNRLMGGTTTERLKPWRGNFIASLRTRVRVRPGYITAELRQDQSYRSKVYGPVHEYGATIVPKRGRYLAIPLNAEARAKRPRQFAALFAMWTRARNLILALRVTATRIQPMYLLVTQVVIPARRPFGATWDVFEPKIVSRIESTVDRVIGSPTYRQLSGGSA